MIKIKDLENKTIIFSAVTDFSDSLGYCEYKIPIIMEGVKAPPSIATLQGSAAHNAEEEYEKEHVEFEELKPEELADTKQDVEFPREEVFTRLLVPLKIGAKDIAVSLFGRTDKIFRSEETLIVQDDKFPQNLKKYTDRIEPYADQRLQALTYLNSLYSHSGGSEPDEWFEIPHKEKAWIIQIRDKNDENKPIKIFRGFQDQYALTYLHYSIERFASLVLGVKEPNHHNLASKCKPCRYFDKCEMRLE